MPVYKRKGTTNLWCQFYVNGKLTRVSTGETEWKDAERAERAIRAKIEGETQHVRRGVGTLKDLAEGDKTRVRTNNKSKGHIRRVADMWTAILLEFGDGLDPIEITSELVFQYVELRRVRKENDVVKILLNQSIRRELQALRRGLQSALEKGWIDRIPTPWPRLKAERSSERRKGKRLSKHTVNLLLGLLPERARDGVVFALSTGLRLEELKSVQAAWVHPAPIGSRASAVLALPDWATKGRKARILGLNQQAAEIAKRLSGKGDTLFGEYDYSQAMKRAKHKIEKRNESLPPEKRVPTQGIHMRSLRHTFASEALQKSKGNLSAVARAMGHSELEITTLYLHAHDSDVLNLASTAITVDDHSQSARRPTKAVSVGRRKGIRRAVQESNLRPSASESDEPLH